MKINNSVCQSGNICGLILSCNIMVLGDPFSGGNPFGSMNAEDILKSFFGGNNAGPFGSAGSNFTSGGFQEAAQVE